MRLELRTLSGGTAFVEDAPKDVAALRARVAKLEGVPSDELRLTSNGRDLHDGAAVGEKNHAVTVLLRLLGGKGGFGAMLRTAGARGVKTTNFDACRDLNGRRLRHVNAEARLREWDAQAEERKLKKQQDDAKNAVPKGPQITRFDDDEYDEMLEKTRSSVADALAAGLASDGLQEGAGLSEGAGGSGTEPAPLDAHLLATAVSSDAANTAAVPSAKASGKRKVGDVAAPAAPPAPPKAAKMNAAFDPLAALGGGGSEEESSEGEEEAGK